MGAFLPFCKALFLLRFFVALACHGVPFGLAKHCSSRNQCDSLK
jgi:hypothetical protein